MSNIHNKLTALLNMTVERGATEDEAETAMRLAAALAAKHNIDLASINKDAAKKAKIMSKRNRDEISFHQMYCAQAAADLMGVRFYVYNDGKRGFEFIGREELVASAEQMMFWLFRQVEAIYKESLPKGLSQRERAEFRKTFKAACALRVRQRALALMRDLKTNSAAATIATGHNALVVAGYFDTLKEEIADFERNRYKASPEQEALWAKQEEERAAREKKWREENPAAAAKLDKA
jgi:hypothetical protein